MSEMRLLGPAGIVAGTLTRGAVSCRACVKQERHHFGPAIGGRNADVRNIFPAANSFGQSNSGSTSNTDDHVSVENARDSVVHHMSWHVDDSRVENPNVEIRDEALNVASEGYS